MLEPFGKSKDYIVRESVKKDRRGQEWTYRLFSDLEPDPYLAVVLGDFLFNVRSALDHIAVALVLNRRKDKASFPIFLIDPEQSHPGDEEGDTDRRERWETRTRGMPPRALAVIRNFQPYNAKPPPELMDIGLVPADTVLAVLSAFQNADKHKRLVTTAIGLIPETLSITERQTGEPVDVVLKSQGPTDLGKNGAIVFRGRFQVDGKARGATVVAAGIGKNERGPYRRLPGLMTEVLEGAHLIVDGLEAVMK